MHFMEINHVTSRSNPTGSKKSRVPVISPTLTKKPGLTTLVGLPAVFFHGLAIKLGLGSGLVVGLGLWLVIAFM